MKQNKEIINKMLKHILILILFTCFNSHIKATDWFPVGAKWTWGNVQECCGPPPRPDNPFYWNAIKDTIIQNKKCSIIEEGSYHYPQQPQWMYRYIYQDDNGKITRFIDGKFLPVYDFNKTTNDTILVVTDSGNYSCDTFLFVIDSVKPLQQNNQLKVQYGKLYSNINCPIHNGNSVDYLSIVEKVGLPFLYSRLRYQVTDQGTQYIRCYEDSAMSLHFTNFSCDSIITLSKLNQKFDLSIKIYPNPASNEIQITYRNFENYSTTFIELLNIQGSILYQTQSNTHINIPSIDVSMFPNGVYLLKIWIDKELITKQIVIFH